MFFSVITKNLNWEILTKNLVTFKRWMGLRMKSFSIMGVHWKIRFLGEIHEKPIYSEGLPKKGAWTVFRFKKGFSKKEGVVLLTGVDTQTHAMNIRCIMKKI